MEASMLHNIAVEARGFSTKRTDDSAQCEGDQFVLLREMHHRLANSFAILAGMARHEFGRSALPAHRQSLDRLEARIIAFAQLHRFLTVGVKAEWMSAQCYIERLCLAL